jgi:hypothetical protein
MSPREDYQPGLISVAAGADLVRKRPADAIRRGCCWPVSWRLKPEAVITGISQQSLAEDHRHDALARPLSHQYSVSSGSSSTTEACASTARC